MSRTVHSTLAPLFDRLCGFDVPQGNGVNLDARGFQYSLLQDLSRIFNTRCDLSVDEFLASDQFVLNYGIPALTVFSPNSKSDMVKLERLLEHAITLYEPRLTQVRVKASNDANDHNAVKVEVLAAVIFGEQTLRFAPSFHLHPGQLEVVVQPEAS